MLNRRIELGDHEFQIGQDLSLSHAGTVWDGALALIGFLNRNLAWASTTLEGRRVLELGTGTGVVGISLSVFKPARLILTDLPAYLSIAKKNVHDNGVKAEVVPLEWGNVEDIERVGMVDVIVGSEIAYSVSHIEALLKTIGLFQGRNSNLTVIVSYQKYAEPDKNLEMRAEVQHWRKVTWAEMDQDFRDPSIGIMVYTPI